MAEEKKPKDQAEPGEEEGRGDGKSTSDRLWTPYGEPEPRAGEPEPAGGAGPGEEEIGEEELRRRIEEALEKITVADVILDMMISLSSLAFQRIGIPAEVNARFKDLEQARLAIDCLDALCGTLEGRVPADALKPLVSTLDNLKFNFAKES